MEHRISQVDQMTLDLLNKEFAQIDNSIFAKKSDRQLLSYDRLSEEYKQKYILMTKEEKQCKYSSVSRARKLTVEQVEDIRKKYVPHVYGKAKLASEYGVSTSVIYRILQRKSWNI